MSSQSKVLSWFIYLLTHGGDESVWLPHSRECNEHSEKICGQSESAKLGAEIDDDSERAIAWRNNEHVSTTRQACLEHRV